MPGAVPAPVPKATHAEVGQPHGSINKLRGRPAPVGQVTSPRPPLTQRESPGSWAYVDVSGLLGPKRESRRTNRTRRVCFLLFVRVGVVSLHTVGLSPDTRVDVGVADVRRPHEGRWTATRVGHTSSSLPCPTDRSSVPSC